jgi:hypothetical protein
MTDAADIDEAPPRFEHHDEVSELDDEALDALLVSGDPPERVWAAWELGLRRGDAFTDRLRERLEVEPHFGVRRHVVVMLAGFGDLETLRRLARDDPSPYVRATACQHLCPHADDADVAAFLRRRLECDDHRIVHSTLLQHLPRRAADDEVEAFVEAALTSDDRRLREAAERWAGHDDA